MERDLDNLSNEISQKLVTINAPYGFGPTSRPTGTTTAGTYLAVNRENNKSTSGNKTSNEMTPMERFESETFKEAPWHAIARMTNSVFGSAAVEGTESVDCECWHGEGYVQA